MNDTQQGRLPKLLIFSPAIFFSPHGCTFSAVGKTATLACVERHQPGGGSSNPSLSYSTRVANAMNGITIAAQHHDGIHSVPSRLEAAAASV
ncbi:MAG: hypothetical protein ACPGPS_15580, partial [Rubripirellula sp.]